MSLPVYTRWYHGKIVLLTGATSGIGRELAKLLVAYGAKVIICGRDAQAMASILGELQSTPSNVLEYFLMDLSDKEAVQELILKINNNYSIDILINNAGIGFLNNFWEMPEKTIIELEGVNLIAVVDLCRAFLPGMVKKPGSGILNVGSVASFFPTPGSALYGATKYFILGFTDALHQEMISKGVHITGVYPGNTKSCFMERSTSGRIKMGEKSMHPALVAERALNGLCKNKIRVVPGFGSKLRALVAPIMPISILLYKVHTHTLKLLRN
jgi:short-subunit dehydrogenase